jgi:transcriptional regulator with XRE-family HTH domain
MPEARPAQEALIGVLLDARTAAGLTQRELGTLLKRQHTFVGKIENGSRQINVVEFVEVARALKVDPAKLLTKFILAAKL